MKPPKTFPAAKFTVNVRWRDRFRLLFTGRFYVVARKSLKHVDGVEIVGVVV